MKKSATTKIAASFIHKWQLEGDFTAGDIAVIIPALGEGEQLWATLDSLAANPVEQLQHCIVVVVINSCADSDPALVRQNISDLAQLRSGKKFATLRLSWIDATSANRQMPPKQGGVGLARKIGCELILTRLSKQGILVQLDADTLVDNNYLAAITATFNTAKLAAAVIPYRHQRGTNSQQQQAINHYELYMRCHALGLRLAGSPYAYHTIGSAIACTHNAYLTAGGMNCRRAGEDFYFLQQLAKTCGVGKVSGTVVHPAPRISTRTPFGTGQVIHNLSTTTDNQLFFAPQCYRILGQWLQLVVENITTTAEELNAQAKQIDNDLGIFLHQENFAQIWSRLCQTHRQPQHRLRAFHEWFDGLKTLRCLRFLSNHAYPMATASQHVPPLLRMAQLKVGDDIEQWLATLAEIDCGK